MSNETAWTNWSEWKTCYQQLYSLSLIEQKQGCYKVHAWSLRKQIPNAILSTRDIVECLYQHASTDDIEYGRLALSMCLVRFVNGAVEVEAGEHSKTSVADVAKSIGIPHWLVSLRHEATHNNLPSLSSLRVAAMDALRWLSKNYWLKQETILDQFEESQHKSSPPTSFSFSSPSDIVHRLQEIINSINKILKPKLTTTSSTNKNATLIGPLNREEDQEQIQHTSLLTQYEDNINECIVQIKLQIWPSQQQIKIFSSILLQKLFNLIDNDNNTELSDWTLLLKDFDHKLLKFSWHLLNELINTTLDQTTQITVFDDSANRQQQILQIIIMSSSSPITKDRQIRQLLRFHLEQYVSSLLVVVTSFSNTKKKKQPTSEFILSQVMPWLGYSNDNIDKMKQLMEIINNPVVLVSDNDHLTSKYEIQSLLSSTTSSPSSTSDNSPPRSSLSNLKSGGIQSWIEIHEDDDADMFRAGGQYFAKRFKYQHPHHQQQQQQHQTIDDDTIDFNTTPIHLLQIHGPEQITPSSQIQQPPKRFKPIELMIL
jgi:hypothetical protein